MSRVLDALWAAGYPAVATCDFEGELPNHTDSMFTTIEGDWDEVMEVVRQACDAVQRLAPRVGLTLKADIRPGVTNALVSKVHAVERYLQEPA